jgi:hypothetical protein
MSEQSLDQPLALAAISLDLHEIEQSCLSRFDVSAQAWLARIGPHADVEEFVKAFGAYLEKEIEREMLFSRASLASDLRFLSEGIGAILSRLVSTLKARRSFWLLVARAKAEKIPTPAEPIISAANHKGSRDSNAKVAGTQQPVRPGEAPTSDSKNDLRSKPIEEPARTVAAETIRVGGVAGAPRSLAPISREQITGGTESASVCKRKPARRDPRYEKIEKALRQIAEARPKNHNEVFSLLDERGIPLPRAAPFVGAKGWLAAFHKDKHAARVWLSKAWSRLNLPSFSRGPK